MFVELIRDCQGQQAGTRIDVSAEDAELLIRSQKAKKITGDPLADVVSEAMAEAIKGITGTLTAAMDGVIKEFAHTAQKSRRNALPAIFGDGPRGDPQKSFGAFLVAVRAGDTKALEGMGATYQPWDSNTTKAAMSTQTGTTGGYLIPTEHHDEIMALATEMSVVRPRATIIPMAARETEIPYLDVATVPTAGDTAFLGGLVGRWTEEATALNETEPIFKQARLTNYELSGYSKISNTLLQDGGRGLEVFLRKLFARAIAWYEDYAFLRGNGTGKPLGIINWAGFISVTRSAASAFALADYAGMLARWLPNYNTRTSCWVAHPTVLAKLYALVATSTMFVGDFQQTPAGRALGGLPFHVTEKLPALNTAGDILLADFSQYLIGDRQQIEVAFSEHAGFTTNQTYWRFVSRVAGLPWMRDKITLQDATSTISPFVGLAAG